MMEILNKSADYIRNYYAEQDNVLPEESGLQQSKKLRPALPTPQNIAETYSSGNSSPLDRTTAATREEGEPAAQHVEKKSYRPSASAPDLTDYDVPLDRGRLIMEIRLVLRELITVNESRSTPYSMAVIALALGGYLQEVFGLKVKLFVDLPSGGNIPPGWLDGLLVVTDGSQRPVVFVDCAFQAKFIVARPTLAYSKYLESTVPTVFVGTEKNLSDAIEEVMSKLQRSLRESNLDIAPWRTAPRLKDAYVYCLHKDWYRRGKALLEQVQGQWSSEITAVSRGGAAAEATLRRHSCCWDVRALLRVSARIMVGRPLGEEARGRNLSPLVKHSGDYEIEKVNLSPHRDFGHHSEISSCMSRCLQTEG